MSDRRDTPAELRGVEERLAAAAREEREILAEAAAAAPTPEEDAVMERARAAFGAPRPSAAGRPGSVSLLPVGLAAAALLAVGLWLGGLDAGPRPGGPGTSQVLGARVRLLAPLDRVDHYDEFRWEYPARRGQAFEVTIWDDRTGNRVTTSPRLGEPRWAPPRTLELPARIRWQVLVLDAASDTVASGVGHASRAR